jgi:hypothetical protein
LAVLSKVLLQKELITLQQRNIQDIPHPQPILVMDSNLKAHLQTRPDVVLKAHNIQKCAI